VDLIDGTCHRSWIPDEGALKPADNVRKLCVVDPENLRRLRDAADAFPEEAWKEPAAKFGKGDYNMVTLHFVEDRDQAYSPYTIFPAARQLHSWIEPILLNVTARYKYAEAPSPQRPGYLNRSIPRLMFARLGPYQKQARHVDLGLSSNIPHKLHIPLDDGNGLAPLVIGDDAYYLEVGYAYEVHNQRSHHAINYGPQTRLHLIFEYLPDDVGSTWTTDENPISQTEFQRRMAEQVHAMTPEQRKEHEMRQSEKKRKQREARARKERLALAAQRMLEQPPTEL